MSKIIIVTIFGAAVLTALGALVDTTFVPFGKPYLHPAIGIASVLVAIIFGIVAKIKLQNNDSRPS